MLACGLNGLVRTTEEGRTGAAEPLKMAEGSFLRLQLN
jgi:hypothetical protein